MKPYIFQPIFIEKVWGGNWIKQRSAGDLELNGLIGEAILFSDENKTYDYSNSNWNENIKQRIFNSSRSPLMIKVLDAQQDLSVQVHPKEGDEKKSEAWYVLEAEKDAEIIYGLKGSLDEFANALINSQDIDCYLNRVKVEVGDYIYLPSGMVHALGKGIKVLEIQQNSNTTYRLYDYGRDRKIHVEEGLKAIDQHLNYNLPPIQKSIKQNELSIENNKIKTVFTKDLSILTNYSNNYAFIVNITEVANIFIDGQKYILPPLSVALFEQIDSQECIMDAKEDLAFFLVG